MENNKSKIVWKKIENEIYFNLIDYSTKINKITFSINSKNLRLKAIMNNNMLFIGGLNNSGYFESIEKAEKWLKDNYEILEKILNYNNLLKL